MIFQLDLSDELKPQLAIEDNVEDLPLPEHIYYAPIVAVATPIDPDHAYLKIAAETRQTILNAWSGHSMQLKKQGYTAHTWSTTILERVYQMLLTTKAEQESQHEDHHE